MANTIELFRLAVPQAELDDLRGCLLRTCWPDREMVDDTSQGSPLAPRSVSSATAGAAATTGDGAKGL